MATNNRTKAKQRINKPKYEQIISMNDDKINVLVLGTSGCGKSTLINAILEANEAETGCGEAVTKEIAIYQNESLPFRMIDTVGYEYGLFKQLHIRRDLSKFCKEGVKSRDVEKLVHMIWFCIEGTNKKIAQDVLGYIKSVTKDWKNIPVIIVFTKSYSSIEVEENTKMAKDAIEKYNENHKKNTINVQDIIPVVAKTYQINDTVSVPPTGLDVLINKTVSLAPEAIRIGNEAIKQIDVKIKNSMANAVIGGATASAVAVGAIPLPIPDAGVLVPVQTAMLSGISKIYDVEDKDASSKIVNTVLKVGGTTMAGRGLLTALKAIPGLRIASAVLNAAVAGAVTLVAGEVSNIIFQKVYLKEMELADINWEKEITKLFNDYLPGIIDALSKLSADNDGKIDIKKIGEMLVALVNTFIKKK